MGLLAPTYSEFIASYPQFETLVQTTVQSQLDFSTLLLDTPVWGEFYSNAVSLDCAHNLVLTVIAQSGPLGGQQAAAGPLTSTSAAGMSASFASINVDRKNMSENWYLKTIYGQQFLRLRGSVIAPMTLAN